MVGGIGSSEKQQPSQTFYYCSLECMQTQQDKEEKELWEKGDYPECKKPLAVINEECEDLEHKKIRLIAPYQKYSRLFKKITF